MKNFSPIQSNPIQSIFFNWLTSLGLFLFLGQSAIGQSWTAPSTTVLTPNASNVRVGIGTTIATDVTHTLTLNGNFLIRGTAGNSREVRTTDGLGLNINLGNATTTTAPTLGLKGAQNCGTCIPGSVKIESGGQPGLPSSAPLEVGWNAVRIGTGSSLATLRTGGYIFGVAGKMIAQDVTVKEIGAWPDFVFAKDYQLKPLAEVESYIKANQHLPGIPSECDIKEKDGLSVSDMLTRQMQKIEELTLYLIEQDKALKSLRSELENIKTKGGAK